MKSIKLTFFCLVLSVLIQICLYQSEGFLPKVQDAESNEESESNQQTTFERVVNFDKFTLELTTKNKTFIQRIQLIPMQSTNIGSVFFNVKNNERNQRGWKISLNKGKGYDIQNINEEQMKALKRIFRNKIGRLITKDNKITKIKLFQPQENEYCGFEVSQLKNSCWRIDIYPKKNNKKDLFKYIAHLKMCALTPDGQKKFRKFTYLLNNKSLGKTSKE